MHRQEWIPAVQQQPGQAGTVHSMWLWACSLHDVPVDGCGVGRLRTVPAEPVPADVAAQRCRGGWEVQQRQVGTYPIVFVQPGSMGMACLAGCAAARKASWLWVGHRPDPAQQRGLTRTNFGYLTPMLLMATSHQCSWFTHSSRRCCLGTSARCTLWSTAGCRSPHTS